MREKISAKLILRLVIFLIILCMVITWTGKIYIPFNNTETNQAWSFYQVKRDTVDVLFVGSSTVRNGFSPNELWHNYGIVAYTRGDGRQAPEITYYCVKEALRTQKPKVVVLGVTQLFKGYDYEESEPFLRIGLDYKRISMDKIDIARILTSKYDRKEFISYIFPLIRYHSRWSDIEWEDVEPAIKHELDFRRGQYRVNKIKVLKPRKFTESDHTLVEYDQNAWDYYKKAINLCQKNNIKVIVAVMPDNRWTYGMYSVSEKLIEGAGAFYLDMNRDDIIEAIDIKWDKDFYDRHHLNLVGCRKASKYLGDLLTDKFDVPQWKCTDELKADLDDDYVLYEAEYQNFMRKKYNKQ